MQQIRPVNAGKIEIALCLFFLNPFYSVNVAVRLDNNSLFFEKIKTQIRLPAEHSYFANGFESEPRCGYVGYAAAGENDSRVADVFIVADYIHAGGIDFDDFALSQRKDNVNIVNHHIQDDADIRGAK